MKPKNPEDVCLIVGLVVYLRLLLLLCVCVCVCVCECVCVRVRVQLPLGSNYCAAHWRKHVGLRFV